MILDPLLIIGSLLALAMAGFAGMICVGVILFSLMTDA